MALYDLSAAEMLAGFKSRTLSPVDVTQAILGRIAQWEPHIHATYALNGEQALRQAHASEARWRAGATLGPLDGVPVMIKENIATRGVATPLGTAATDLVPSAVDAPPAQRLRESGAVLLGKTTMPDYGMLSSGLSSFHELARNPWNLATNPGGSSAGAGAGVAAGYGPLHLGTDIGGSVRLPAGWCGIFGLKPSNGRIPIDPPYIGRVAGPMTRNVRDAALSMAVLSQPDARDYMSLPHQAIDWLALDSEVKGLRIGLLLDAGCGMMPEPEVLRAVEQAAKILSDAGAHVELMPPFLTPVMLNGLDDFWRARAWADLAALPEERRRKALPFIVDWACAAALYDGQRVFKGFSQITAMRIAATNACAPFDFVLSPTAPLPAFAAELPCPTDDPARPFEHIGFTVAFNMSEQPAASINCGYTADGLPIGLQIVGQRFDDLGVLRLAYQFEQLRPKQRPWPEPPGA
ncbi:amidase [Methylovirgula sp. 4M-Z18]|uniref:amidase n=1 Tax=Methylovirgula sp. 4M-Z18 TaxID=2293567 RepID=UPI000E2F1448|nr:amidase [Methylovirgula sp. 4M-Z18]RFB81284.1 amidase [Methylovirgula sp. 4M-Z18]